MYGQITVCIDETNVGSNATKAALSYAQHFKATVHATYIKFDATEMQRWQGSSSFDITNKVLADIDSREYAAKQAFEAMSQHFECETVWHTVVDRGDPIKEMLCTDLIFIDQPNADISGSSEAKQRELLNRLLLESKRPIIMVPSAWEANLVGNNVVLGWNATPEAMRAASDAMPILLISTQTIVVDVLLNRMSRDDGVGIHQMQGYLSRKRVPNQLLIESCDKTSEVASTLLRVTEEKAANLIVVGGYGHSRLREVIMGGVTDNLIKYSPVPVFFSH